MLFCNKLSAIYMMRMKTMALPGTKPPSLSFYVSSKVLMREYRSFLENLLEESY